MSFSWRTSFIKKSSILNLKNYGSYTAWSDGTIASTCEGYRNPTNSNYKYTGATGDGIYRIKLNGNNSDVYCLMTRNSHGYVLVAKIPSNSNTVLTDTVYSNIVPYFSSNIIKYYQPTGTIPYWVINYSGTCGGAISNGWASEVYDSLGNPFGVYNSSSNPPYYSLGTQINQNEGMIIYYPTGGSSNIVSVGTGSLNAVMYSDLTQRLTASYFMSNSVSCPLSDSLEVYVR